MKSFIIRPGKFESAMMIFGGVAMLYALNSISKDPDGFGSTILTINQLLAIIIILFGFVNLVWPKGLASARIDEIASSGNKTSATESFAALQHLYEKGLLTHEEYRRKVDLLTRADTNNQLKK